MTEQEKKQMKSIVDKIKSIDDKMNSIASLVNEMKNLTREYKGKQVQCTDRFVTIDEVLDAGGETLKDVIGGAFAIVVQKSGVVYSPDPYGEIRKGFANRRWGSPKRASEFETEPDYDSMYKTVCMAIGLAIGDKLYRSIRLERESDLSEKELNIVYHLQKTKKSREDAATAIAENRKCSISSAKEVLSRYKFLVFEDEMDEFDLSSALDTVTDDDKRDTSKINQFDLFNLQ